MAKSILVIDDDAFIIDVITTVLTDMGFEVTGFQDPDKGIQAALKSNFDLVLSDLRMPGTDGAQVTKAILASKPDTRVLIITAFPSDPLAKKALDAGAVSLVQKPFEIAKILDYLYDE